MNKILPATLILCLFLASCDDEKKGDRSKKVDTKGSIAVTLSTQHIDSLKDLVTTHYVVWSKGAKVKEFDVKDTIPSLGLGKTEAENDNGDSKDVMVPKDYDFFVTVK